MAIPLDQPLNLLSPDAATFLGDLQGNILKSHGRDHAAHLFIRFRGDVKVTRAWVAAFAAKFVTTAADQLEQTRRWRANRSGGELFSSILLSHSGYVALGVAAADIPAEAGGTYFEKGMKNQAAAERPFNDPPSTQWEPDFRGDVHALVILAHDVPAELTNALSAAQASLSGVASATWAERGDRLEFAFPTGTKTIEHFGFEDGISNPVLILQDAEQERADRGFDQWDGAAPLSLVLAAEPGHPGRFGSFFVFRKLEQNVQAFHTARAALAATLGDSDVERAGAMAVGRFRDGTPIIPTTAPVPGRGLNNFHFRKADPGGAVCPFHAHIRKTNPRGDTPLPPDVERGFRIARRGITYGVRPDLSTSPPGQPPTSGVGLLFMSYQARLDQFAIQQEGSDSNDFISAGVGVDAVIGQNATPVPQEWPAGSGRKFTMANFVKMLGGEYFFAPSIPFLREIASTGGRS